MLHCRWIFLIFVLGIFLSPSISFSFNIPEKFEYDLTWAGIKAGTSTLEITNAGNSIKIISTSKSVKWVSVFYDVDDRVESTLVKNPDILFVGQPVKYRIKLQEGRQRRDKEVIFKHPAGKAVYTDYLANEKQEFPVPFFVFDPLSSFYYIRTLQLEVGHSVYVTVFDSKKTWNVEIQVLRKEKVALPTGTVDTIVIKPLMKSEGIFYKKGNIHIWLTDDEKRIPVKLQTKVAVGSVTATLVGGRY
ncbi:MAG: DUF3108 domain-containing protein [Thermodesulfovibrionales bacterium]|nr:DUF3108 domain-containing protein [Thermodesulfovibrionales bacterium]